MAVDAGEFDANFANLRQGEKFAKKKSRTSSCIATGLPTWRVSGKTNFAESEAGVSAPEERFR
jgi:hypothetical protein